MASALLVFCSLLAVSLSEISSSEQLFVGGLYQTLGSTENLHSFGEYFPGSDSWSNLNSGVLSTGTSSTLALVESPEAAMNGMIVGGIFNYLNNTSNDITFGNIAFFRETTGIWETLGFGCNAGVTTLIVIPIINSTMGSLCTEQMPCFTVIVGGYFSVCFQDNADKTAISYPDGLGFFDLTRKQWYTPVGEALPERVSISSLQMADNSLFLTGNSIRTNITTGWAFQTELMFQNQAISILNWTEIVSTNGSTHGRINTCTAYNRTSFYIGGLFNQLQVGDRKFNVFNVARFDAGIVSSLENGTNGEVVSSCLVTTTTPSIFYVAGSFSQAGFIAANNIARWDVEWNFLAEGLQLSNYSTIGDIPEIQLSSYGSNVVVGGAIRSAGEIQVENIALWDGSNWNPLGNDSPFAPYRMLPFAISISGTLHVAAQGLEDIFLEDIVVQGYPLVENLMAKCNLTSTIWSDFVYNELLLDGVVASIEYFDEAHIILGGGFRKVGDIKNLNNIIMLSRGIDASDSFDGGVYGIVTTLQIHENNIYVGGILTYNGMNAALLCYSKENGWTDLGLHQEGGDDASFARPFVFDILLSSDFQYLYVGGSFKTSIGGNVISNLVGFDITIQEWFPIAPDRIAGRILTLAAVKDLLYIGGDYTFQNGNVTSDNFSLLQTNGREMGSWQHITPTCNQELKECASQAIRSIVINPNIPIASKNETSIYIGGSIENIDGNVMNGLARLVDQLWVSFGEGITGNTGIVYTLELTQDYQTLYAGGDFTNANSIPVNDIVAWDVQSFSFSALAPIQGWSGVIFDLLTSTAEEGTTIVASPTTINKVLFGATFLLLFIVCCLLFIITFISIKFLRTNKSKEQQTQMKRFSALEKEEWEEYYSYEWEVSYNLLEISGTVGNGRNGTIHKAMYKGQLVAVKIFNADIAGTFYLKESVCKYSSLLRSLQHPNIIHVIGASADPLALITDYSELGSLSDIIRIKPGKLTWQRVKSIALDTARGMSFLHGQQPPLFHQNLTSNNIIINEYWAVKICDAGLSKVLDESGEYKVSPPKRWTAPEVLLGRQYTRKSDVFSYGMMLYHLIGHILPYTLEEKDTDIALSQLIIRGVRPMVPPNRENIPIKLIELMKQCWHEKAEERPEFRDILTKLNAIPDSDLMRRDNST